MSSLVYTRVNFVERGTFRVEQVSMSSQAIVRYGVYQTVFGRCLLAHIDHVVCFLGFMHEHDDQQCYNDLSLLYNKYVIVHDHESGASLCQRIFNTSFENRPDMLFVGTLFQIMVWTALLKVPEGSTMTYITFARSLQRPQAVRAVASAIARNNIAYLVPCHRIISATERVHKYRWGAARKKRLIEHECSASVCNFLT